MHKIGIWLKVNTCLFEAISLWFESRNSSMDDLNVANLWFKSLSFSFPRSWFRETWFKSWKVLIRIMSKFENMESLFGNVFWIMLTLDFYHNCVLIQINICLVWIVNEYLVFKMGFWNVIRNIIKGDSIHMIQTINWITIKNYEIFFTWFKSLSH